MAGYKEGTKNKFADIQGEVLTIVFDSADKLHAFKAWLSDGGGEDAMSYCEALADVRFDYWSEGNRLDARTDTSEPLPPPVVTYKAKV